MKENTKANLVGGGGIIIYLILYFTRVIPRHSEVLKSIFFAAIIALATLYIVRFFSPRLPLFVDVSIMLAIMYSLTVVFTRYVF